MLYTTVAMKTTTDAQKVFSAKARRRDDGMVIYSQEGTSIENRVLRMDQVPGYLSHNGAFPQNVERFMHALIATGCAEIQQPKLVSKFSC
jgi:hypothetical protein